MKRPLLIYCTVYVLATVLAIISVYMAVSLSLILLIAIYIMDRWLIDVLKRYKDTANLPMKLILKAMEILKIYKTQLYISMVLAVFASLNLFIYDYEDAYERRLSHSVDKEISISATLKSIEIEEDFIRLGIDKMLVYLDKSYRDEAVDLKLGYRLILKGRLSKIKRASNQGGFDAYNYYRAKDIYYILNAESMKIKAKSTDILMQSLYELRLALDKRIAKLFPKSSSGIVSAALIGDKGDIDEHIYDMYQRSGISHLLAISGLHISILGLGIYKLLRKFLKFNYLTSCISVSGLLILYALLTGFSSSVVRAVAMLIIACIADVIGRSYELSSAAALSLIISLVISPYNLTQGAVLLSYTAVFSISMVGSKLIKISAVRQPVLKSLLLSITISFYTLPIILHFFYSFSPYSILLNLIVIPLMSFVLYFSVAAIVCSYINIVPAKLCAMATHIILEFYIYLIRFFEKMSFFSMLMGIASIVATVIYYVILLTVLCLYLNKKLRKLYLKKSRQRTAALCTFILIHICSICLLYAYRGADTEIKFIDVGQGDGIYMSVKGQDILIDAGSTSNKQPGKYVLEPFLKSQAVDDLEKVFITHADRDHSSGIIYLLEESDIGIDTIYLPILAKDDDEFDYIREAAGLKGTRIVYITQFDKLNIAEDISFTCISPSADMETEDSNEKSIVLLYREGDFKLLLTGDAGIATEEIILKDERIRELIKEVDILKVGHHGSFTASGDEFVRHISPEYAILSYADNNIYGHPHRETLYTLDKYKVKAYHTAVSGQISLRITKGRVYIDEFLR